MWGQNVSCHLKFWPFVRKRARLFTGPLFFRKFVRIERLPVRAAILVLYVLRADVGVHGRGREAIKIVPLSSLLPKPSPARQVDFALIQGGRT